MSALNDNLKNAFTQNRVVFWYDKAGESKEQYEESELPEVKKVMVNHNAFALKYRILKEEPKQKFLLYFPYERPEDDENWLLDIELSNFVFDTEQSALYLQGMGLDYIYKNLVQEHLAFFGAKVRREQFVELFNSSDSTKATKYKMLSLVFGTDSFDLQTMVQAYANSYFSNLKKLNKDLERYNLRDFLWKEIAERYKYEADNQNIYELIIEIFENSFALTRKEGKTLTADARLILSSWRDSYTMRDSYKKISEEIAPILQVEELLQNAPLEEIIEDELFELTDQKIIVELVQHLLNEDISKDRFLKIIKTRESKFWFSLYKQIYRALENAFALFEEVQHTKKSADTPENVLKEYVENDYKIDYHYRKFYEYYYQSQKQSSIKRLLEKIEKVYVNDWLFTQGNTYQQLLNQKQKWQFNGVLMQGDFFEKKVDPILQKQKIVVIISDALRYECGVELAGRINKMDKYDAQLEYMVSALPSYTQLGMASLLPHKKISFDKESDRILVDGLSATGTENREKILTYNSNKTAKAMLTKEFTDLKSIEGKGLIRDYEVIYLYSNKIDKTGDDKMSENEVFTAAKNEIEDLVEVVRALFSANASRVLITADHGFIYQDSPVNEGDFIETQFKGETFKENRRFVLGSKLVNDSPASTYFKMEDLGIDTKGDVLIAKGINRYKVKGAGSRFVHGGASLQETIIPLLDISKGRDTTVRTVEIEIVQSHNKITTNSLPIEFIQKEAISERVLAREIKAFIQAEDGKVLSDVFNFNFDFTGAEFRQRSKRFVFHMISEAATKYRNQTVDLVLQVPIENTSKWKDYKRFSYTLNISFTNDFD